MKSFATPLLFLFLAVFALIPAARADYFVWEDAQTGISATFPDNWNIELNQEPETVLTIVGPSASVLPICRLKVHDDGRFTLYPVNYEDDVQKTAYSHEYWNDYLMQYYDQVSNAGSFDSSGLGRSHAVHGLFNFIGDQTVGGKFRQGIGFVSHYYDKVYIAECTANSPGYSEWVPHFMNFFKSVDYTKIYNEYVPGHYRDFLHKDAETE